MYEIIAPPLDQAGYERVWEEIADAAAFQDGFTRAYCDGRRYVQLEALLLPEWEAGLLGRVAEGFFQIGQRLTALGRQSGDLLLEPLTIPAAYRPWLEATPAEAPFTRFARLDFVKDGEGRWHLLEINAREPGGVPELAMLERIYHWYRSAGVPLVNPNAGFAEALGTMLRGALPAGPVGFCSSPGYLEDFENAQAAARLWGGEAIFGGWPTVGEDGPVLVSGQPVAGLYTYLPTESYEDHPHLLNRCAADFPIINPGSAVFMQSKGALALAHQLCAVGSFFSEAEQAFIETYLPYTSVAPMEGDWVAKPFWNREGEGVYFGVGPGPAMPEYVYQRRVAAATTPLPIWRVDGPVLEEVTPVVGVYLVDGKFAGFLTRVGGPVTDRSAHVIPTFVAPDRA